MKHRTPNTTIQEEFHDACGIGFIAELAGQPGRRVIELAIEALKKMSHRGASAADDHTGDGAGLLTDLPVEYFRMVVEEELGVKIGEKEIGIAMVFTDEGRLDALEKSVASIATELNIDYVGRRKVPTHPGALGQTARQACPLIMQFFFADLPHQRYDFETRLYLLRKTVEQKFNSLNDGTFICSLSSKTIVYKGMMKPEHLTRFYSDLNQPEFKARVALFHERFSTNTISNWSMAQPFRMLGHNGEINTIKGNRLWMQTREETIRSNFWGEELDRLKPLVSLSGSDSYSLDNILEFLVRSGRSMFHSIMMLIPEPYIYDHDMPTALRDFYIYHENHIEPWDGPAALVFTDGQWVGAKLDRNGLRPLRYTLTKDNLVIMASEAGVVDIAEENVLLHHHMKAGENFAIRLQDGKMLSNDEIIREIIQDGKYSRMIGSGMIALHRGSDSEEFGEFMLPPEGFDTRLRVAFGMDKEDLERFLLPMAQSARESVGSMGDDAPPAVISTQGRR
ncbi:MAG TPA: glutamate synthase central domain-containing protein, partial [bacterium]